MSLTEFIQKIAIPLISVITAIMVAILNHQISMNDQKLKEREQTFKEELRIRSERLDARLNGIDLLVKKSKEERDERESNQGFNLKIYEILEKSLVTGNEQQQHAATAFILVMVTEPKLRASLLGVLLRGGEISVRKKISQIIRQEDKFQSKEPEVPKTEPTKTPSYNWDEWKFDIFWCSTSGDSAKKQAELIGKRLVDEGAQGRVRVRELPDSINAKVGYQIDGYVIRRSNDEKETALALKTLAESALKNKSIFNMSLTRQRTESYISMFLCPAR